MRRHASALSPLSPPRGIMAACAAARPRPWPPLSKPSPPALVLLEIVILLAGVIARYVFHSPLVWSDELASILFLWLSMLGAVIALRRGEHMRMTGLLGHVGPPRRGRFSRRWRSMAPLALAGC